jgi:hypothetical protein
LLLYLDGFGSLDAPSPPPPVGQPLLDPQQQILFDQFFDNMLYDMVPSVNPAHIFDPDMPNDATLWPGSAPPEFQHANHALTSNALPNGPLSDFFGSSPSVLQSPHIEINPFSNPQAYLQPQNAHTVNTAPSLLSFGTDTNFAPNGYHPPPLPVQMDKDSEIRSKISTAFTKNESVITTAVNSPTEVKFEQEDASDGSSPRVEEAGSASPGSGVYLKRRIEEAEDSPPAKTPRTSRNHEPTAKKRTAAQKRDNLTESQKRENHIHSEQKRRDLIRQGFEELCALVPELKAGGYSKSAVLVHAANYLDDLKKGNTRLRLYLQQLESARQY